MGFDRSARSEQQARSPIQQAPWPERRSIADSKSLGHATPRSVATLPSTMLNPIWSRPGRTLGSESWGSLLGEHSIHSRPRGHTLAMVLDFRETGRIDAVCFHPSRQGEQIRIANSIVCPHHPRTCKHLALDQIETLG